MSLTVIKIGGDVLAGADVSALASEIAALSARGDRVVIVHGGGPQATQLQRQLGQTPAVVAGRRITDEAALDVMKMVVAGRLNIDLCAALLAAGASPVGLHGASSLAIRASKRPPRVVSGAGPNPIDFGHVGDVVDFNVDLIALLLDNGYIPVMPCIGANSDGELFNINADIIANAAARRLCAEHVVLVTGTPGVLRDVADPTSRIPVMTVAEGRRAIADGSVSGGMIPKLDESAITLSEGGVGAIHIIGRLGPGELAREIDEPGSVGTALVP